MFEFGVTVPILGREECGYYNGNRSCIIIPFQVLSRVISFRSLRTLPHESVQTWQRLVCDFLQHIPSISGLAWFVIQLV